MHPPLNPCLASQDANTLLRTRLAERWEATIWPLQQGHESRIAALSITTGQVAAQATAIREDGSLIRELILDPARDYQPLGTPSGHPRVVHDDVRHVSTMSLNPSLRHDKWLGREDSNLRLPDPESGALPLGNAPLPAPQTMTLPVRLEAQPKR